MGWPTFSNLLSRVIILVLVAIGFYQHWSLFWLVTANGTVTLVNLFIDWFVLVRRYGLILPKLFGFAWSKYYRSVVMLGAVTIVNALYLQVDTIILSGLRSPVDVGIYGAAQKIVTIVVIFQGMFLANFFPFLIEQSKLSTEKFQKAVTNALVMLMVIGLPLGLLVISIPTELVRIVAGRQFISTSTISIDSIAISTPITLAILGFYVLINYFDGIFTNALIALDRLKWLLGVNLVALVFNIALNLAFDRTYTYFAAAILTVATELIIASTAIYKLKAINHIALPWGKIARVALASFIAIAIMFLQPLHNVFVEVVVFGVVYLLAITIVLPDERNQIKSFLNKEPANE
jgi:O-antigen/teichoic acid export membrane protein